MAQAPNFRRRRIVALIVLAGLIAPLPAELLGARDVGRWIFAVAGTWTACAILALPLDKLRRPVPAARTFRPPIRHLVFDGHNPVGVVAFVFELVLVGLVLFAAFAMFTGFGLRSGEPRPDPRLLGPLFAFGAAVLLWPIADWFASCVHITGADVHIRVDNRPKSVRIADIQALIVRHGRRSPAHNGAVLAFELTAGNRILLPGTTRDAESLLACIKEQAGVELPRIDRPIRKRSA